MIVYVGVCVNIMKIKNCAFNVGGLKIADGILFPGSDFIL